MDCKCFENIRQRSVLELKKVYMADFETQIYQF